MAPSKQIHPNHMRKASPGSVNVRDMRELALKRTFTIGMVGGMLAVPFAVHFAAIGHPIPLVAAILVIANALFALGELVRGRKALLIYSQTFGYLAAGTACALMQPGLADFGLALILLAPVNTALLGRRRDAIFTWWATGVMVLGVLLAHMGAIPIDAGVDPALAIPFAAYAYLVGAVCVGVAFRLLNKAYVVSDQSQLRAFKHLFESVQDAVVRYARSGDPIFISHSADRLFGCAHFQLSGEGIISRVHVLDRPAYLRALDEARTGGTPQQIEIRVRQDSADGPKFIWVEFAFSPVPDERAGEGHETIAIIRDISDRRNREDELAHAKQQAEEGLAIKTRFLATIGHELRTPLNAIVGFSDMMLNQIGGELSKDHAEYAHLIKQSGNHLIEVVSMLLEMSRIESGKVELTTEPFDLVEIVQPCLAIVGPGADERNIAIRTSISSRLPQMVGDERAVRQILVNLLTNAVKFSHADSEIVLAARMRGSDVEIRVEDRGIGIEAADLGRVGEPFFQASNSLARKFEGTGLGLSIVRGLVELHDGSFSIRSEKGSGTTVTIRLPVAGPARKTADDSETVTILAQHRDIDAADTHIEERRVAKG